MKQKVIKDDRIVLLGKPKFNAIKELTCKSLIDLYISHYKLVSVNKVLKEYNEMKEKNKKPETSVEYTIKIWFFTRRKRNSGV